MERRAQNLVVILLIGAMAAAAVLLLALEAHLTFFGDTWETLMNRRHLTADALLQPHNEHIVLIPVLLTQALLRIFGMSSAMPEFVLLTVGLLATAALFFVYVRRRVGDWLALFATLIVLFLGPAWEAVLWPFEIGFVGSVCFGLAMLLALEREDRRGDLLACGSLALALGFSSVGISFAVAGAVAIALGPRERWLARAYVVVVPGLLFALWYLGWGHDAESHLSLHNVLASPRWVAEEIAVAAGAMAGLGADPTSGLTDPVWGRPLLLALAILAGILAYRRRDRPGLPFPGLWPMAAAALTNWVLAAFNAYPGRDPTASRYQYASVIFLLAILANLLRDVRFDRRGVVIAGALAALALGPNLVLLKQGKNWFYEQTVLTRADTGALEIARRTVDPEFQLGPEVAGTPTLVDVNAEKYFEAVDEFGSPAYTPAELLSAPPAGRRQADIVLASALPLSAVTEPGGFGAGGAGCTGLAPGGKPEVALNPGLTRVEIAPGAEATLRLRRFAGGEYPVTAATAPGGSAVALRIPRDSAPAPWQLLVEARQRVRVCPTPSAG